MRNVLWMLLLLPASASAQQWSGNFNFGAVNVGSDTQNTIVLTNTTDADETFKLCITSEAGQNAGEPTIPFYVTAPEFDNTTSQLIVPAGQSVSVLVEFRPKAIANDTAAIVATDASGNQFPAYVAGASR